MKRTNKIMMCGVGALLIFALAGCGGGTGTSASDTSSGSSDSAAAAVTAMFSNSASASLSKLKVVKIAHPEQGDEVDYGDTCTYALSSEVDREHPIEDSGYSDPGAYGSLNQLLNVSESDFCSLPDGTENEGTGPDGKGRLAAFELIGDIEGNCENEDSEESTITMKSGSYGVWRNTEATEDDVAYSPQIFGRFSIQEGDEVLVLDCTIYLDENETALFADCSDEAGETIVQDSSASCSFAAE